MKLEMIGLTKAYGQKRALEDFSYVFEPGIYGILGANGAGKSTLMNLITDNTPRTDGRILYDGEDILSLGKRFRSVLGYMPQQQGMYEQFSARAFLYYVAELKEIPKAQARVQVERLLRLVNVKHDAHRRLGGFSGGMRQRVLLAQALLGDPQVLLLDEPTAGLDPRERIRLRGHIKELSEDKIVLLTTHIVSDVESIADDVLLMQSGHLVRHGSPAELMQACGGKNLEDVYMAFLGGEQVDGWRS